MVLVSRQPAQQAAEDTYHEYCGGVRFVDRNNASGKERLVLRFPIHGKILGSAV